MRASKRESIRSPRPDSGSPVRTSATSSSSRSRLSISSAVSTMAISCPSACTASRTATAVSRSELSMKTRAMLAPSPVVSARSGRPTGLSRASRPRCGVRGGSGSRSVRGLSAEEIDGVIDDGVEHGQPVLHA